VIETQLSLVCFARLEDGQKRLHFIQPPRSDSHNLKGDWKDGATLFRFADPVMRKQLDIGYMSTRVRQLSHSGFTLEALIVTNAMFEVILRAALCGAVASNPKASLLIDRKGHSYRLELLQKVVAAKTEPGLDTSEFLAFSHALIETNLIRNQYLHQLVLPVEDAWSIGELDRVSAKTLRFVSDPHLSFITVGFLAGMGRHATDATTALLVGELQKLKEWQEV
jgi:hypothetical protein